MIVEEAERPARAYGVSIQVGKHLLTSLKTAINKKHYRNSLIAKPWFLTNRLFDCCPAVLTIVDNESRPHIDMNHPHPAGLAIFPKWLKSNIAIYGCGDSRKDV